jgi:hypothetical protein
VFGKQLELRILMLNQHRRVPARLFGLVANLLTKIGTHCIELLLGRQRRQNLLYVREAWLDTLKQNLLDVVKSRRDIVSQKLLDVAEPMIEGFEMLRNHGVVHARVSEEKESGARAAILASRDVATPVPFVVFED